MICFCDKIHCDIYDAAKFASMCYDVEKLFIACNIKLPRRALPRLATGLWVLSLLCPAPPPLPCPPLHGSCNGLLFLRLA
eukprot:scaffold616554_cov19-Prasinocladus_malaysianus.AAC.1